MTDNSGSRINDKCRPCEGLERGPLLESKKLSQDQVLLITKALADPRRYDIVRSLGQCGDTKSCESMRGCIDISPATFSHHMKELATAGLVHIERQGKFAYYTLHREVLEVYFSRLRNDLL